MDGSIHLWMINPPAMNAATPIAPKRILGKVAHAQRAGYERGSRDHGEIDVED
jgi:hypothetical protein